MTPLRERLKYYPDYIDDPDGLERFRQAVRINAGHDMADVNYNSLGRLIDTIERLRRERDAALSQALPAPGEVERALILARDLLAVVEQTSGNVWFVNADDPETAVCDTSTAVDKALATVAAANDEGVARGIEIAAKVAEIASATGPSNEMWQYGSRYTREQIVAAIRLLSQGGGRKLFCEMPDDQVVAIARCDIKRGQQVTAVMLGDPGATSRSQHEGAE